MYTSTNTTWKRILVLLLATMTVLPACGNSDTPDTTDTTANTSTEVVETETELTTALPDTDWEGREFRVLGQTDSEGYAQFSTHEIDAEELNGEALNDAVFNRNTTLEDRYNVVIVANEESHRAPDTLTKLVAAGEDLYYTTFVMQSQVGSLVLKGNLQEMTDLPYIDYSMPW